MYKSALFFKIIVFSFLTLTFPVIFFLNFNPYYKFKFNNLNVYAEFNYEREVVNSNFDSMIQYINGTNSSIDPYFFSPEDRIHLSDVRRIVITFYILYFVSIVAYILSFKFYNRDKVRHIYLSSVLNISIISIILLFSLFNFERLFVLFHEVMFSNEYWLLDSETSNLIKYFPESIFREILSIILAFDIIVTLLIIILWTKKTLRSLLLGVTSRLRGLLPKN